MAADAGLTLVDLDDDGVDRAFRADVLEGLRQPQKAIPARWLYDDAGSQLFEDITQVEEYYPTRAETEILQTRGTEFAGEIGPGRAVVEFGSGSSVKTPLLLEAIDPGAYVPLDIAGDFLRAAAEDLAGKFPGCRSIRSKPTSCARSRCPSRWRTCPSSASSPARRSATWCRAPR